MKKHTVSLKLAKQMEKLGWEKETLFWWARNILDRKEKDAWFLIIKKNLEYELDTKHYDHFSAPIASEILEELPQKIDGKSPKKGWYLRIKPIKNEKEGWEINYVGKKRKDMTFYYSKMSTGIQGATPAEALGKMWTYLKEEKII